MLQISITISLLYNENQMSYQNKLNLEQEFQLAIYKQKINKFYGLILKKHLLNLLKLMMLKDNLIKYFIKNEISWNIK